jgi:hypothetical protein
LQKELGYDKIMSERMFMQLGEAAKEKLFVTVIIETTNDRRN